MEAFKNFFHLDVVLRQCLAGVCFYGVLLLNHPDLIRLFHRVNSIGLILILIAAFLTGSFFHVIARSLLGSGIDWARRLLLKFNWLRSVIYEPHALEMNVFRMKLQKDQEQIARELRTWGSSAHCLYTIGIAVLIEQLFDFQRSYLGELISVSLALLLLGLFADCRKFLVEEKISKSCALHFPWDRRDQRKIAR